MSKGILRAGVIGHPISHSRSPRIHGYWLEQYGIAGEYKAYDIAPENLRDEVMRLRDTGLSGFNVTLPHKQKIMDICTTLNDEARRIGAVNTVVFHAGGEIEGRNTDAFGFMENALAAVPDVLSEKRGELSVAVIGAGGAARAVLFALQRFGVAELRLTNRTLAAAEDLAEEFGTRVYEWHEKDEACIGADLIVNTTSLGMTGQPSLELNLDSVASGTIVYDIVYAPLQTQLLKDAAAKGCRTITGIGMLLHQARPGFQAWFGQLPEITPELEALVLA